MATYVTGTGQKLVRVHDEGPGCFQHGCTIHNPTDPHKDWPTHWRSDLGIFERICPHGVGHPDKDSIGFIRMTRDEDEAAVYSVHGCDGCCR